MVNINDFKRGAKIVTIDDWKGVLTGGAKCDKDQLFLEVEWLDDGEVSMYPAAWIERVEPWWLNDQHKP